MLTIPERARDKSQRPEFIAGETSEFAVGALVHLAETPIVPYTVRVIVGVGPDGVYLTSYLAPPPWLSDGHFPAESDRLAPVPHDVAERLGLIPEGPGAHPHGSAPADAVTPPARSRSGVGQRASALTRRFEHALQEFEQAASPPEGAEAPAFWSRLRTRFVHLEQVLVRKQGHNEEVLEEIGRVDSALIPHTDRLRDQGAELFGRFLKLWKTTRSRPPRVEAVWAEELEELRSAVLAWIEHCREHERKITALFIEAHLRDRGIAG